MGNDADYLLQANGRSVRFPSLTLRDLGILHPKRILAISREISYPQVVRLTRPGWAWLSLPPGPLAGLLTYWIIIVENWIHCHDAYYWERIGLRASDMGVCHAGPFDRSPGWQSQHCQLLSWFLLCRYEVAS